MNITTTQYIYNNVLSQQPPGLGSWYVVYFPGSGYKLSLGIYDASSVLYGRLDATIDNLAHQRLKLPMQRYTVRTTTSAGTAVLVMTKR